MKNIQRAEESALPSKTEAALQFIAENLPDGPPEWDNQEEWNRPQLEMYQVWGCGSVVCHVTDWWAARGRAPASDSWVLLVLRKREALTLKFVLLSSAIETQREECGLWRTNVRIREPRKDHTIINLPNVIIWGQAEGEALLQAYSMPYN